MGFDQFLQPCPHTVRWWSFNQNCKIHEKDYHGIVVHTLGGHNSLCLKSYKFKIKKMKQMKKFKIFFHYKKRKILKQNTTISLLSWDLLRCCSQLKVLSTTPGAITNVFLFVQNFSTFYWQGTLSFYFFFNIINFEFVGFQTKWIMTP